MKILFLGANPSGTSSLDIKQEVIEALGEVAIAGTQFEWKSELGINPVSLQRAIIDFEPDIVHFSGHGVINVASRDNGKYRNFSPPEQDEPADEFYTLILENSQGEPVKVSAYALAELFKILTSPRCVILNACFSVTHAKKIAEHVDFVIGMNGLILDQSAIKFAVGFYQAIARKKSFPQAFELGKALIRNSGLEGAEIPRLHRRWLVRLENYLANELQPKELLAWASSALPSIVDEKIIAAARDDGPKLAAVISALIAEQRLADNKLFGSIPSFTSTAKTKLGSLRQAWEESRDDQPALAQPAAFQAQNNNKPIANELSSKDGTTHAQPVTSEQPTKDGEAAPKVTGTKGLPDTWPALIVLLLSKWYSWATIGVGIVVAVGVLLTSGIPCLERNGQRDCTCKDGRKSSQVCQKAEGDWLMNWTQCACDKAPVPAPSASVPVPIPDGIPPPPPSPSLSASTSTPVPIDIKKQVETYLSRARSSYEKLDYVGAIGYCNKALGLDPQNMTAKALREEIKRTQKISEGGQP